MHKHIDAEIGAVCTDYARGGALEYILRGNEFY
jgi:hypothetical protein